MEGIAQSKDEIYGQYAPDNMLNSDRSHQRWEAWEKSGVMASEMETAAIFIDGSRCESRSKYGLWEDEQSHYRTCL